MATSKKMASPLRGSGHDLRGSHSTKRIIVSIFLLVGAFLLLLSSCKYCLGILNWTEQRVAETVSWKFSGKINVTADDTKWPIGTSFDDSAITTNTTNDFVQNRTPILELIAPLSDFPYVAANSFFIAAQVWPWKSSYETGVNKVSCFIDGGEDSEFSLQWLFEILPSDWPTDKVVNSPRGPPSRNEGSSEAKTSWGSVRYHGDLFDDPAQSCIPRDAYFSIGPCSWSLDVDTPSNYSILSPSLENPFCPPQLSAESKIIILFEMLLPLDVTPLLNFSLPPLNLFGITLRPSEDPGFPCSPIGLCSWSSVDASRLNYSIIVPALEPHFCLSEGTAAQFKFSCGEGVSVEVCSWFEFSSAQFNCSLHSSDLEPHSCRDGTQSNFAFASGTASGSYSCPFEVSSARFNCSLYSSDFEPHSCRDGNKSNFSFISCAASGSYSSQFEVSSARFNCSRLSSGLELLTCHDGSQSNFAFVSGSVSSFYACPFEVSSARFNCSRHSSGLEPLTSHDGTQPNSSFVSCAVSGSYSCPFEVSPVRFNCSHYSSGLEPLTCHDGIQSFSFPVLCESRSDIIYIIAN